MGTHNQNVVPGSDNTYDLGTSSARWKDLFLRHGMKLYDASGVIWELDYRGVSRHKFCGVATLTPADIGTPDTVSVQLPQYIGNEFIALVSAPKAAVTVGATIYDIYPYWHAPVLVASPVTSAFQAFVSWNVFNRSDGRIYINLNGIHGPWSNMKKMCADCPFDEDDIPDGLKQVYWIATWPL